MLEDRYFTVSGTPPPSIDAHAELLASLERINNFNPPVQTCSTGWTFHGLYSGPTSIAFLFWRLSQYYPNLEFKSQLLVEWAHAYLLLGSIYMINLPEPGRAPIDPDHCGIANESLSQTALRATIDQDESLARRFCAFSHLINSPPAGSDTWLYGRSGYLYFLRLIRNAFTSPSHDSLIATINNTISSTITRILSLPQPWTWQRTSYIGAVHGSIGVFTQIILSHPKPIPTDLTNRLTPIITGILSLQEPDTGDFPISLKPSSTSPSLVQFCHGAPGITHCLRLLLPHFPSLKAEITNAIEKAQLLILSRGHLTKPPCLCHGIPSNALALTDGEECEGMLRYMASEQLEGNERWMAMAGRSDDFVGLWTGEAGRAWCWAVLDESSGARDKVGKEREKKRVEYGLPGFGDV